jgi:hypothetical protein
LLLLLLFSSFVFWEVFLFVCFFFVQFSFFFVIFFFVFFLSIFFSVKGLLILVNPNYLSAKNKQKLEAKGENEAMLAPPGHLVLPLAC